MNNKRILYILSEQNFYGSGMVFNFYGNLLYTISAKDVELILDSNNQEFIIINPQNRTIFYNEEEKLSINKISNYFSCIFKDGSPISDTSFFAHNLIKSLRGYSFHNKKILDFGCGNRQYALFFPNSIYYGYDIITNSDLTNSIPKNEFDVVLCNFVLEHVADPFEILKIISKSLKFNGIAIISIPSVSLFSFIERIIFKERIYLPLFHLRTFSFFKGISCIAISEIIKTLKNMEFDDILVKGVFSLAKSVRIIIRFSPVNYFGNQTILVAKKNGKNWH